MTRFLSTVLFLSLATPLLADPTATINVWPGKAPGEMKELPPEVDVNKPTDKPVGDRKIIKLTNVSTPTLAIYQPPPDGKPNGAALIICPGGGHNILAYDHEGTECAEYFAKLGVTCFVLKYRVPARSPDKRWIAAVQDAQRAVSLVRSKAADWKIDPQRVGILGFSAGGETAGLAAILHEQRQYEEVDAIDKVSARPDFAALIYPGGFTTREKPNELRDYVKVDAKTPPMFLVHAYDDPVPVANSLLVAADCKKAGVNAELHIYASGGHGYGMRKTGHPVNSWTERCAQWLESQGWMKGK